MVSRLRCYSEGEETVGVSALLSGAGPLPDLVPVPPGQRERSLSVPDMEHLQRQRRQAREVGRELRRISDEFMRSHEAARGGEGQGEGDGNPHHPFLHLPPQATAALVSRYASL